MLISMLLANCFKRGLVCRSLPNSSNFSYSTGISKTASASSQSPEEILRKYDKQARENLQSVKTKIEAFQQTMTTKAKRWNEQYNIYYGKERDMENFPTHKIPEYHPKVRMGVFPDAWFQAFYDKTGVTGPYLFFFGGITFLLSKELWVTDHEFHEVAPFVLLWVILNKTVGIKFADYIDKEMDKKYKSDVTDLLDSNSEEARNMISSATTLIANESAQKQIFDAKRESVHLQLEAAYRDRLNQYHRAVKSRMDYQVQRESARRQMQQQYMVDWIVNSVVKNITPALEKSMLSQCVKDLQGIAAEQRK